jgi:hypothetical protein
MWRAICRGSVLLSGLTRLAFLPSAERSLIFVGVQFFRAERGKTAHIYAYVL